MIGVIIAAVPLAVGILFHLKYIKKFGKNVDNIIPTPSGYLTREEYCEKYKDYRSGEMPGYKFLYSVSFSVIVTLGVFLLAAFINI
jgi:hypothetical protein